jgi:hypothetical protein
LNISMPLAGHAKALSPLRSASAVHNALEQWPIRSFCHTYLLASITRTVFADGHYEEDSIFKPNHNQQTHQPTITS